MKYLVLLLVLLVAVGIWRNNRRREADTSGPAAPRPRALAQDMLACAHCGLHIPRSEALVAGPQTYCCAEHQRLGPR